MEQKKHTVIQQVERLVDMGHVKRNACVVRHVTRLVFSPGAGPSQTAGSKQAAWAESKSWYDLINNPDVSVSQLRELRARVVLEQASGSSLLVLHDITECDFSKHAAMSEKMEIGDHHGTGYEYHPCVAWDFDERRFVGVLHDTVISALGPDDVGVADYDSDPALKHVTAEERQRLLLNHRHQLATHIRYLATQAANRHLTHVADREFDDVLAMAAAREVGAGFVFRCLGNRNVRLETGEDVDMASLIASLPMRPYKSLGLDARGHVAYGKNRPKRVASLSIGACRVFFFRPCTRGERRNITLEEPLGVHLVVIRELEAPNGEKPLCWLLFTSLPIDTQERQTRAAAYYEQRWRIEEYFKLLKSGGFDVEKSHFTHPDQFAKVLVFYSLAAMALLTMKQDLGLQAIGSLPPEQYEKVRHAMPCDAPMTLKWSPCSCCLPSWYAVEDGWDAAPIPSVQPSSCVASYN